MKTLNKLGMNGDPAHFRLPMGKGNSEVGPL